MYGLTIYTDEELKRIQTLELEALKELVRICEQKDIEYFLIDGAAIGAVRHKGFIPWDDDIDVGMTRDNYRRFLKEAPELLSDNYYLQTPYKEKSSPYFYSKLRVNGTRFVEYCNRKLDIHDGVYIDICPFDEVPDNEILNAIHFRVCQILIHLFVWRQSPELSAPPVGVKGHVKSRVRGVIHYALKVIPYGWIASALEAQTTRHNGTNQKALAFLHYPKRKVDYIRKEELMPLKTGTFGDIDVNLPGDADAYLTRHYGKYMELPPEEERYGHKPYLISL